MADVPDFPLRPFVAPARVLAGPGSVRQAAAELLAAGAAPEDGPVLVVADAALIDLGLTDGLLASLVDAGFTPVVGPGVSVEPKPETIEGLLAMAGGRQVAAVIGIGGGSAIDASKLVAAALSNDVPLTVGLPPTAALGRLPTLLAVPTTAGTGAETTAVAMLWHEGRKRIFVHARLVPQVAVLDPDLLAGLPRSVAAASGLDALSHAVEATLSTFRTPLTLEAARSAIRRLARALPVEYRKTDPSARLDMSLGAYEAGLALNASVVIGHSLAYCIAARTGLSHGVTCAMALPYCLAYSRAESEQQIAEVAELLGLEPDPDAFIRWLTGLTVELGIPSSLEQVGIGNSDLAAMARECCDSYPRPNSPRPLSSDDVEHLLHHFQAGAIDEAWASAVGAR